VTNFKPKTTVWVGSQLSYNDHISNPSEVREDLYCLTLAQTEALIAVIEHYRYRSRWIDDDVILTSEIEQFVNDTQRRLMMPCGTDNQITLSQFTPDGHYQTSTDGGATYTDNPQNDPRNSVTIPPPFLPPDTEDEKCTYADSIVNMAINGWINATGEGEDLATVIEGMLSFLAGILGAVGAIVGAVVLAAAASIVGFTVAAWKASFTSAVWDRLRCNLSENMGDDGTFTQSNVDSIYSRIGSEEVGITALSLQQMIAALGWQGLTIAARAGFGSPTAECCVTPCTESWSIFGDSSHGVIDSTASDYVDATAGDGGDGTYYLILQSTGCCIATEQEILSGAITIGAGYPTGGYFGWDLCGETSVEGVPNHHSSLPNNTVCIQVFQIRSTTPFSVRTHFTNC